MTRKAIIELVKQRLKFTDTKTQFPALYVQGALDIAWQQLCTQTFDDNYQDIHFYSKTFNPVAIVEDTSQESYYSDLPEEIIRLPRIGEGVISINQVDSRGSDFKPVRESDFRLMTTQEVYRVGDEIYWYTDYNRVYYGDSMTFDIATTGVEMHLCIPFSKYGFEEELPLPGGQSQVLINMALEFLQGTPPVNTDNKNAV